MASARHKHVLEKMSSHPRRLLRLGIPAAAVLTLATVTVGVASTDEPAQSSAAITFSAPEVRTQPVPVRVAPISRSEERVRLAPKPPKVTDRMFAVEAVNIRALPDAESRRIGAFEWGDKVPVSGKKRGEWVEVVLEEKSRWVHSAFLSDTKPEPEPEEEEVEEESAEAAPSGISGAPCPTSGVESGLSANGVAVHRAVCNAFPQITSYGGLRADSGEHGTGHALDVMVSGGLGWQIAEFVRANAGTLGVSEVIYSQKIWTVQRGGEGWRYMSDRGSSTANHYDHVHVTVY